MAAVILNLDTVNFSDKQFYRLCQVNPDWQLERSSQGELIVMPSVGGVSGNREADFIIDLGIWNRQTGLGKVFSSSTIFRSHQPIEIIELPANLSGEYVLPRFSLSLDYFD